ncbi:hypothetical protein GIW26_22280 [Pseudomonas syringae]|nr:hypothetical protein [Pseudomonas syringae]
MFKGDVLSAEKEPSAARKAAQSTIIHEDLVDAIEALGQANGLDVEATKGNDSRGDLRVKKSDFGPLIKIIEEKLKRE